MDEKTIHRKELLGKPGLCLKMAIEKGYPTAVWRLPNQERIMALVHLSQWENNVLDELEDAGPGFLFNPFDVHHPSKPFLLQADLLFEWDAAQPDAAQPNAAQPNAYRLEIAPTLSSEAIDRFLSEREVSPPDSPAPNEGPMGDYQYEDMINRALTAIRSGHATKLVLSRCEDAELPSDFDLLDFFGKACDQYPNAFCYVLHTPGYGTWVGATPETFISLDRQGIFQTVSLAGTQRLDNRSLSQIAWTQKDIEEQAMVSRYIIDCFKKIRLREFDENGPRTSRAGNLVHLKTQYRVDTRALAIDHLPTTMMNLLHPTSAVCGMPLQPALEFIKAHENYDRSLYAGFLGPINIHQETHLFVNLRCMQLLPGHRVRYYAGGGITADSDPHAELLETRMKMNTLKKLFED